MREWTDNKLDAMLASCKSFARFRMECQLADLPVLITEEEFQEKRAEVLAKPFVRFSNFMQEIDISNL